MARPIRGCALCLKTRPLCNSHLVPREIVNLCRDEFDSNPHPYILNAKYYGKHSAQFSEYLLCADCEQVVERGGEDWMLRNVYRGEKDFHFREKVLHLPVLYQEEKVTMFSAADAPDVGIEKLSYFVASVIWRASTRDWRFGKEVIPPLELGPYKEQLRRYLKGECSFPEHAYITVFLCARIWPRLHVTFPSPSASRPRNYRFFIPGFHFVASFGRTVKENVKGGCLIHSPFHPIFITQEIEEVTRKATLDAQRKVAAYQTRKRNLVG